MNNSNSNNLVSIITPLYNCSSFLLDCVNSVLSQTYTNWEMIIVDDHSNDNSYQLALDLAKKDNRIKVFQLLKNSGSAIARNKAIKVAKGRFIAFLDSDDIWHKEKLKIHVLEMLRNNASFSHTSYGYINESGDFLKKTFNVSVDWVKYKDLLKRTEISCLTAMYDVNQIGKLYMPDLRRKQDYALWLLILKKGYHSFPVNETLAWYRQRKGSATSKKHKLIFQHYRFLISTQKLNPIAALYYTICWGINGILKYYL